MTFGLQHAVLPHPNLVYRVGRKPDVWAWPGPSARDPAAPLSGHRWNDPKEVYSVLYATTQRRGALIEVLARFRPDPKTIEGLSLVDGEDRLPSSGFLSVRDWLACRSVGSAVLHGAFADVTKAASIEYLRAAMAEELVRYRITDLDVGTFHTAPRGFTQAVSRHIYEQATKDGERAWAGIRYVSRIGDEFENWVLFQNVNGEPAPFTMVCREEIYFPSDDDFTRALDVLNIRPLL